MLYTYSPSPHTSNWFQDFIVDMVSEVLRARSKRATAKTWDELLPPLHKEELRRRRGLKDRYGKLIEASVGLTVRNARQGLLSLGSATYYDDVLSGSLNYKTSLIATADFNIALTNFLSFAFQLLRDFKNSPGDPRSFRDDLYFLAYGAMPGHFCPFCGLSRFDAPHPEMPRHALDHYLPISAYPIFGTYLPNLVPMCDRCNSSFKLAADMLTDENGNARACVDPHGSQTAAVSLMNSEPFGNGHLPRWEIQFVPALDAFETWDQVFKIRFRYKENILDAEFKAWLADFSLWALIDVPPLHDSRAVSIALGRFSKLHSGPNDQGFIKGPVFEMLAASATRSDAVGVRITGFIQSLCGVTNP